jgi:hypothetical protein
MKATKRRKSNLDKRLAKERDTYHRCELAGGCVLLEYRYWQLLAEKRKQEAPQPELTPQNRYGQLLYIARQCGFKDGWAAFQFKDKFGDWPPSGWPQLPQSASPEVKAWVKQRRAAYLAAKKASGTEEPQASSA